MGFIKETLETVQCDNCKTTYQDENSGYGFWLDRNDAWESANDDVGWRQSKVKFIEINKLQNRISIDPSIKSGVIRIRSDS
jgi:hypothetical protein